MKESNHRHEIWIYFALSAFLMAVGFVFGLLYHNAFSHELSPMLRSLTKSAAVAKSSGSWLHVFGFIFIHNAITALELSLFGIIVGLFPAFMMWMNGLVVGYVVAMVSVAHPGLQDWKTVVLGLLPHGVFELTAIFWASALGIANGMALLRSIRNVFFGAPSAEVSSTRREGRWNHREHPLRSSLWRTFRTLPIIWGILVVAAVIEATITPHLLSWGIPNLNPV